MASISSTHKEHQKSAYFLLWSMTDDPFVCDEAWFSEFWKEHSYPCRHSDFSYVPESVTFSEAGADVALSFIAPLHGQIIRADLRKLLEPEFDSVASLVPLVGPDGNTLTDRWWFLIRERAWLRASAESYCWRCTVCKRIYYTRMGQPWHLLRENLPQSAVFGSESAGIVIHESVRERFVGKKFAEVRLLPLPVLDEPIDGFPADLEQIRPEQEREWAKLYGRRRERR